MIGLNKSQVIKSIKVKSLTRSQYAKEERIVAVDLALKIGAPLAAEHLNITYSTLKGWFKKRRKYEVKSDEFKSKAIERFKVIKVVVRVAKELKVNESTLRLWLKKEGLI